MIITNDDKTLYRIEVKVKEWIVEHCRHMNSGALEEFECQQEIVEAVMREEKKAA